MMILMKTTFDQI